MGRYEVHRTDANAEELYETARRLGFSVEKLDKPVDSMWGIWDMAVAVEVKMPSGKLRPKQAKFMRTFKGMKRTVRTATDVFHLYQEMRERHDKLFAKEPT